jgi:arsenate reductase
LKDLSSFTGSPEEILQQTRQVRDEIEQQIKIFVAEASQVAYWIPVTETNPSH